MVVKLTKKQADFLKTFEGRKSKDTAFYYISRWGFDHYLKDGNEKVYNYDDKPFEQSEREKMLNALINGYEIAEPKFKFYNFSDSSGTTPLYYAGQFRQLTKFEQYALEVKEDSKEYKALLALGFDSQEV